MPVPHQSPLIILFSVRLFSLFVCRLQLYTLPTQCPGAFVISTNPSIVPPFNESSLPRRACGKGACRVSSGWQEGREREEDVQPRVFAIHERILTVPLQVTPFLQLATFPEPHFLPGTHWLTNTPGSFLIVSSTRPHSNVRNTCGEPETCALFPALSPGCCTPCATFVPLKAADGNSCSRQKAALAALSWAGNLEEALSGPLHNYPRLP